MSHIDHISHSQMSQYQRCARQWEYRYVYGLKIPPGVNLITGAVYHSTLDKNFKFKIQSGIDPEPDIYEEVFDDVWRTKLKQEKEEGVGIDWEEQKPGIVKDNTFSLVNAYMTEQAPQVEPEDVEIPLESMVDGTKILFRIDLIDVHGAVIDHKTAAKSHTQDDLDKDPQGSAYSFALKRPILYLNHVALKLVKPRIQVLSTYRNDMDMVWWYNMSRGILNQMRSGVAPPNPVGWHCSPKYCGFWDKCRGDLAKVVYA